MTAARIAVFGAGAWGTALANVVARAGREVSLIARDEARAEAMRNNGVNPRLPGIRVDERIAITTDIASASRADAVLLVMPAQSLRAGAKALAAAGVTGPVIACAKGIERSTGKFMTEIIGEHLPRAHAAILSGPSFAEDVARGLPTAVTLAAQDEAQARDLSHALGSPTFRVYHSTDVRGVEIGGAAKNVLAIAAGIVSGRSLGASAAAALTTRGFAEIVRFGRAFGARPETLMGLSGLGDLILTCSSTQSRNYSLGIAMGRGSKGQEPGETKLAEGAFTATVLVESARTKGIELPIAAVVAAILDDRMTIDEAIETLLARPVGAED